MLRQGTLLFAAGMIGLAGCSKTEFAANKQDTLKKSSVFGAQGDDATGGINVPGTGQLDTGRIVLPGRDGDTFDDRGGDISRLIENMLNSCDGRSGRNEEGEAEVEITLTCSDSSVESGMTPLKRAIAQSLPVTLVVNGKGCSIDPSAFVNRATDGRLSADDIRSLCPQAVLNSGENICANLLIDNELLNRSGSRLEILYARNRETDVPTESADAHCDRRSSPLVIHRASDPARPKAIELSSREDGVDFDLLGSANGHVPVRISWFTNDEYRFLALPDREGRVNGIDELFGDNTRGPDGFGADNGYAALAKFDGKTADGIFQIAPPDGFIDRRDPIYSRLRLWHDANRDGVGQPEEMRSLRAAGLSFIDLNFSDDFAERDIHGNETKMKSVVGYQDGTLDLIFDLWFAYNLGE